MKLPGAICFFISSVIGASSVRFHRRLEPKNILESYPGLNTGTHTFCREFRCKGTKGSKYRTMVTTEVSPRQMFILSTCLCCHKLLLVINTKGTLVIFEWSLLFHAIEFPTHCNTESWQCWHICVTCNGNKSEFIFFANLYSLWFIEYKLMWFITTSHLFSFLSNSKLLTLCIAVKFFLLSTQERFSR